MRMLLNILLLLVLSSFSLPAEEWVRVLDPKTVSVQVSPTKKVVEIATWKLRGCKNFVNLSFWGNHGPVGRLVVDGTEHGFKKKSWPVLCLDPYVGEYKEGAMKTGFAGSNVLVRDGRAVKQPRSFFSRRRCPRTGVGVDSSGKLIVIVTTSATLDQFSKMFEKNGAVFAINVDGGSSTMFIENGESIWNSKRSAVPVILTW